MSENALIYVVTEIENDGTIAMISRPIHFLEPITDLVAGKNIKPHEILDERWRYFEEEA